MLLALAILYGVMAWGQKKTDPQGEGVTLGELGVSEAQKAQIKTLWELKRKKQIQALENLRVLNRLARDEMASDEQVGEAVSQIRHQNSEMTQRINALEELLIEALPPRAQLHLMILGVLDNGLTPRYLKREEKSERDSNSNGGP